MIKKFITTTIILEIMGGVIIFSVALYYFHNLKISLFSIQILIAFFSVVIQALFAALALLPAIIFFRLQSSEQILSQYMRQLRVVLPHFTNDLTGFTDKEVIEKAKAVSNRDNITPMSMGEYNKVKNLYKATKEVTDLISKIPGLTFRIVLFQISTIILSLTFLVFSEYIQANYFDIPFIFLTFFLVTYTLITIKDLILLNF